MRDVGWLEKFDVITTYTYTHIHKKTWGSKNLLIFQDEEFTIDIVWL